MDQQENLTCQDKMAFDTKKQAESAARTAAFQHGAKLKVYRCRDCGLWHLSTDYSRP